MLEAKDIDQYEAQQLLDDNKELVSQINELRGLLGQCWSLVSDGGLADEVAALNVERGMDKYQCWPND